MQCREISIMAELSDKNNRILQNYRILQEELPNSDSWVFQSFHPRQHILVCYTPINHEHCIFMTQLAGKEAKYLQQLSKLIDSFPFLQLGFISLLLPVKLPTSG